MPNTRTDSEKRLITALLARPEGRIFIGLLIEESGFLRSSARDSPTAEDTYFREGERNVGQRVFEMAVSVGFNPLECMRQHGEWLKEILLREAAEDIGEDEGYGGTD